MKKSLASSKNSFHEGAFIFLISTALVKIIGALFKIPLASDYCLGNYGFGYFSSVYDLFTPFATLALAGLPMAISKLIADNNAKKGEISTKTIFTVSRRVAFLAGLLTALCFAILAVPYSYLTDASYNLVLPILAVLPAILACYLVAVYRGLFEGLSNMVPAAVSSIIEALGKLILGFGLAFVAVKLTSDVLFASFAAVLGISLGSIISLLYIHIKYKSKNKLLPKDDSSANLKAVKKVIIITAVQIAFASLSNTFVGLIDTLTVRWQIANYTDTAFSSMLANYSSLVWEHNEILGTVSSKTDFATILYGIRSKAFTIFNLIPTLVISVGISAIPLLSADFSSGNKSKFNNRIFETLSLSSLIIFPASFGCIAVSKEISCLLYGMTPSSFLCGELLKIYGFAAIFAGLSIVFGCILQSMGEEKQAFINIVIALFTKLVLNSVWVNEADFNILGSAYATLVCFAVVFIRNLISLAKRMDFTLILKSVYKPFTAALVCIIPAMVITRHYSTNFAIILSVTVSAVVYLALLFAFKIISVSQVAKILKKPS